MAVLNIAYLCAILPAVFAMPQHAHMGHGPYKGTGKLPSGFPTGFPHPSGRPHSHSGAPFPVGNGTVGGPTGTGTAPLSTGGVPGGPVTILSTINIIPLPMTTAAGSIGGSPASGSGGISGSPASGSGGIGSSPASGSAGSGSSPSGAPVSGGPGESGTCGPATITITQANTITVTVPAGSGAAPSGAPIQSSPAASSIPAAPSSAPYPIGNSSIPTEPTGTGTAASVGTGLPSIPYQAPISTSALPSIPYKASISKTPVLENTSGKLYAPTEAATEAASTTASPAASVAAPALYHGHHGQSSAQAVSSSSTPAASVVPASTPAASPIASSVASVASPTSSTAAVQSSSVASSGSVKARGLLYGGQVTGTSALAEANAYLEAGNGNMGWCWDWDSSPSPASGPAAGSANVQFVPMLLGTASDHLQYWDSNAAGHEWLMGFNEPDMTLDKGGSQLGVTDCVTAWGAHMQPKKTPTNGVKLVSPATTNTLTDATMGVQYMASFLSACTGCTFDALAYHYYGEAWDMDTFTNTVTQYKKLQTQYNIGELWITEMAPNEAPTADQMSAFLSFLDDSSNGVDRYAFNGLGTGTGQSLTNSVIQSAYQT